MTLIVIFLTALLSMYIYKRTRSYVWAIIAFLVGMLLVPMVINQLMLLVKVDNPTSASNNPNASPSAAYRSTAVGCNCR